MRRARTNETVVSRLGPSAPIYTSMLPNLEERIKWTETNHSKIKQTEEAVKIHEEEIKLNKDFTIEVDEPYRRRTDVMNQILAAYSYAPNLYYYYFSPSHFQQ